MRKILARAGGRGGQKKGMKLARPSDESAFHGLGEDSLRKARDFLERWGEVSYYTVRHHDVTYQVALTPSLVFVKRPRETGALEANVRNEIEEAVRAGGMEGGLRMRAI